MTTALRFSRRTMARLATGLTAVAAASGIGAAGASPATAAPVAVGVTGGEQPTREARRAGITRPGTAWMGWRQDAARAATRGGVAATTDDSDVNLLGLAAGTVYGIDVSNWQGNVDWAAQWAAGKRFAYIKATEGTNYTNPSFAQQYNGSYKVGMQRGSYHFALPNSSTGATQADYFVNHGGGWSADGKTLPGVLDIEYNPYGATCFGLSQSSMRSWIASFTARYKYRTGRDAVIYTTTDWWTTCTGNTSQFSSTNPLWIARYASSPGTLPSGWGYHTFWQYSSSPIDQNTFNGASDRLAVFAAG